MKITITGHGKTPVNFSTYPEVEGLLVTKDSFGIDVTLGFRWAGEDVFDLDLWLNGSDGDVWLALNDELVDSDDKLGFIFFTNNKDGNPVAAYEGLLGYFWTESDYDAMRSALLIELAGRFDAAFDAAAAAFTETVHKAVAA